MRVLFVYRGEGNNGYNSVIDAQAASLLARGINLSLYPIRNGGSRGYIQSYRHLKTYLRQNQFDIVHGHYSYSAIIAALAHNGKTICSLMGSDIFEDPRWIRLITTFFNKFVWHKTIVKSDAMKKRIEDAVILPNGVDFEVFKPIDRSVAYQFTRFEKEKFNIIFIAENIEAKVKNYKLAREAINIINATNIELHPISGVKQKDLVYYYNAADLYLMTSLTEGSPNVIKEAMACNCPIVSTDVGDVKDLVSSTDGCYITSHNPNDVADNIRKAMEFNSRTNGRENIRHLDSKHIADEMIKLYHEVIQENRRP